MYLYMYIYICVCGYIAVICVPSHIHIILCASGTNFKQPLYCSKCINPTKACRQHLKLRILGNSDIGQLRLLGPRFQG